MDEPKRHVVDDYPAAKLPEDLRGDIDPAHCARVTIEEVTTPVRPGDPSPLRYFGAAKHKNTSVEEAVERIRMLRDEWGE
jgi:hypothetical protein